MMTIEDALAVVVPRTGHARYRELCDPTHPDYNPAYIPVILGMAAEAVGRPPDRPPAAHAPAPAAPAADEGVALGRAARACPFASRDLACGCNGIRCALRRPGLGQVAPLQSCFDCIRKYGP